MATRKHLMKAIVTGKADRVERVLRQLRNIDVKLSGLLVTLAVSRKDPKIATKLIKHFARRNKQKIISSFTISLLYATYRGNLTIAKVLVRNRANINSQSRNGYTALHFSILKERINVLKYLIKHGARADLTARGVKNRGFTPLHLCAIHGKTKCASILLKYNSAVVNSKGPDGIHPIHLSVAYSKYKITSLLLNYVYNIDLRFPESIYEKVPDLFDVIFELPNEEPTLLHWAVGKSDLATTNILLDNGANVNLKTRSWITTLMIATRAPALGPLLLILGQCPSVNEVDSFGNQAVHYIYNVREAHKSRYFFIDSFDYQNDVEKLLMLMAAGADMFATCSFDFNQTVTTILDLAIYFGRARTVRTLLYETFFGCRPLNYCKIELAAFDINNVHESDRNDIPYIEILVDHTLKVQSYLASYIENRHSMGVCTTDDDLKKVQAFISKIKISKSDYYYQEEKKFMLEGENYLKSLQVGLPGNICWSYIIEDQERLVKRARNANFMRGLDIFSLCDNKTTYHYSHLLRYKVMTASYKQFLLCNYINIISDIFVSLIPFDCCEAIANYLSIEELEIFLDISTSLSSVGSSLKN